MESGIMFLDFMTLIETNQLRLRMKAEMCIRGSSMVAMVWFENTFYVCKPFFGPSIHAFARVKCELTGTNRVFRAARLPKWYTKVLAYLGMTDIKIERQCTNSDLYGRFNLLHFINKHTPSLTT